MPRSRQPASDRPEVLHVIPVLWSGAGEAVTRLCELHAPRHGLTIATSGYAGALRDWPSYRRRLAAAGVRHLRLDTFARDAATFWSSVTALSRVIADMRPDVVHSHAGVPACVAALARRGAERHVAHMYSWGEGRPAWMDEMDLWGFRQADRVICSARRYETLLLDGGVSPQRLANVPWGVDVRGIDAALARRRPASGATRIGFIGRVEPRKGQLDLVRAFDRVRRRVPGARLELIGPDGDADYAARVRAEIEGRGLGAHVSWPGYVRDVARVLITWQLFVSLSSDEGQGLAVQEAMAAGVPVIALAASGIEDYVSDGDTGWLIASRREGPVARAIVAALESREPRSRIARAGARLIRERYSWDRCVAAIDRLYL